MKYVIDTEKLLSHNITLDELLYLMTLAFNVEINDSTIVSCHNKNFITKEYNPITGKVYAVINKTGTDMLEAFFADCEIT